MEKKYFGCDETEINRIFNSKQLEPVKTKKVDEGKTTSEFLVEGSAKLLKEEPEFLREIATY